MVVNDNYKIAFRQVLEVLKYLPVTYYARIPEKLIDMFKSNMDNDCRFEYNPNISFEEQGVTPEAIEIMSIIQEHYIKNNH